MAIVTINDEYLTAIGNAIRSNLGTTTSYTTSQMPDGIAKMTIKINNLELMRMIYAEPEALITLDDDNIIVIGHSVFSKFPNLTTVNLLNTTTIGTNAFRNCPSLTTVNLPSATTIGSSAFYQCENLTTVNLPNVTTIGGSAFYECDNLTTVDLPSVTTISGSSIFCWCENLTIRLPALTQLHYSSFNYLENSHIILPGNIVPEVAASSRLNISSSTYVYVPRSLYASYQSDEMWSTVTSQLRVIEDWPSVVGG